MQGVWGTVGLKSREWEDLTIAVTSLGKGSRELLSGLEPLVAGRGRKEP